RFADFIILSPQLGLLVLEVKDWLLSQISVINPTHIILTTDRGEKRVDHPLKQARDYVLRIADTLVADPLLAKSSGAHKGKLHFPFSYGVVWTKIKEEEYRAHLPELYDPAQMLFRESISPSISTEKLLKQLHKLFIHKFPFKLSATQIDHIRYHIFP